MFDKKKVDYDAPAFGQGAQKLEELSTIPEESSVEEQQETVEKVEEKESSGEENKVPYSRFKKYHDEARQYQQEADQWRARAEELEQKYSRSETTFDSDMPSEWVELYGDSDASKKAWKLQQKREEEIERRAYEAGQRGAEELEIRQQEMVNENLATIDDNFEQLSDFVGRDLTAKEQSAILDIVDDFTPKDQYGRYAGPLISFEKAWEMYELKNSTATITKRKDRDTVAYLTASHTQGDADVQAEKDRSWNPLARGTWKSKL